MSLLLHLRNKENCGNRVATYFSEKENLFLTSLLFIRLAFPPFEAGCHRLTGDMFREYYINFRDARNNETG